MKKVVKFGGSSLANADQFKKVGAIITADDTRRYVVPSAPGNRFPKDTKVTVAGKICESGDIVVKEVMVAKPEPGDIFAQFSTGAYHYSMASNYNQLPKPAVVFTYQGKSKLVIRRQTFDDLTYYDTNEDYE